MICSESLLECLERVFSEHITDLVEDVRKRFLLVDKKLKESEEQQKTLDSKIAEMGISLKQIMAEKCDLQAKVDALRRFEHSSDDFHSPAHELHETNEKGAMQITPYQTSDKSGTSSSEESVAVMSGVQREHEEISKMIESCGLYLPEGSTVKTIITTLLREHTQMKNKTADLQERSEILRNQLDESVPQTDHQRALDRVRTLEISLEQKDEVIESLKEQAACAIERFCASHISPASSDLNGYIDAVVEELTISRRTIEHLEYDKQETHALLDASVPKDCYDEIAKLLESSRLELNETHGSLKKLRLELDDVSNSLSRVVDVSSNQSLHETVDLVVSKMLKQRSLVEKVDSDPQAFMLFLESISSDPLPDTFE
ncbi:unnamed protein product [Calicophoron daubneyi]|uniref:Uncharacterized protein n=1 Tax=Calicophoron daubneyi TaxID=300641 RepID=A0AAV2T9I9_CALDB